MESTVDIECPPLINISSATAQLVREVMDSLSNLAVTQADNGDIPIGSEIRYAFNTLHGRKKVSADNDFWKGKFHNLLLRPAMEPVAYLFKDQVNFGRVHSGRMNAITSFLLGRQALNREGLTIGRSSGVTVRFEAVARARLWSDDITMAFSDRDLRSVFPGYCLLRVICAHPFEDGNGRLARMLAQIAIMQFAGATFPLLPLAPIMYENAATLSNAIVLSSKTGSCEPFFLAFYSAIRCSLPKVHILQSNHER